MIELLESQTPDAVIKVVGVGGCGGNAVDHMINNGVQGVEFISMNTDAQALKRNLARTTLQLGTGESPSDTSSTPRDDDERFEARRHDGCADQGRRRRRGRVRRGDHRRQAEGRPLLGRDRDWRGVGQGKGRGQTRCA